jgi:hypothetical protein
MTIPFDERVRKENNLTEDEFEYYIERMGFRVESNGQDEKAAAEMTLFEIRSKRNGNRKNI